MDTKAYTEYEQREPCERYRAVPRNYSDGCVSNMMKEDVVAAVAPKPAPVKAVLPIVSSYTILFDLNKSNIRENENKTLDKALNEIAKYWSTPIF
jgi:outer membrane protein OmpA-like peptidoglycan-associated protein